MAGMTLQELVEKYYVEQNYNCAETLLHAANEYYDLHILEEDMKMMAGFGGGMFVGSTCGAMVGCIAALSKMTIHTKAHEELQAIRPLIQTYQRNFKQILGATQCVELKPKYNTTEKRCLPTCLMASQALEKTIQDLKKEGE